MELREGGVIYSTPRGAINQQGSEDVGQVLFVHTHATLRRVFIRQMPCGGFNFSFQSI